MKQVCHSICLRINSGQVRPFVQIAVNARKSEILQLITPAVLPGNDVFNMENGQR